jgi:hypothetical protein
MAELTPDYSKRDCSLPPGCKDLIDVLRLQKRKPTKADLVEIRLHAMGKKSGMLPPKAEAKHDRFSTAGLAQVARYVAMSVESLAEVFLLYIGTLDEQMAVGLRRNKGAITFELVPMRFVSTAVSRHTKIEQTVRAFCDQQGIQTIQDCPGVYSLPINASLVSELIINLLRAVYGLNDDSGLIFYYSECPAAI